MSGLLFACSLHWILSIFLLSNIEYFKSTQTNHYFFPPTFVDCDNCFHWFVSDSVMFQTLNFTLFLSLSPWTQSTIAARSQKLHRSRNYRMWLKMMRRRVTLHCCPWLETAQASLRPELRNIVYWGRPLVAARGASTPLHSTPVHYSALYGAVQRES